MVRRLAMVVLLGSLAVVASGCATSAPLAQAGGLLAPSPGARILIMEPDVQLYEVTAAGLLEPKADWTAKAQSHVGAALAAVLGDKRATIVAYRAPGDVVAERAHRQLIKLHERVGATIVTFRYNPALRLAGKGETFDWTLGETVKVLRDDFDADYALFVRFLDSYASGGRVAAMVVMGLLGVGIPGGTQVGFGSLIDLRTGDIVWFNRLVNPTGDLRAAEPAREAVRALLAGFPL